MVTELASSGQPAGPLGCSGGLIAFIIVLLFIGAFAAAIWWMLRDLHQI